MTLRHDTDNSKKALSRVREFVQGVSTLRLFGMFWVGGFICLALLLWSGIRDINNPIVFVGVTFTFFLWGCSGIVMIVRKEAPLYIAVVHGWPATLFGLVVLLVCWYVAFAPYATVIVRLVNR